MASVGAVSYTHLLPPLQDTIVLSAGRPIGSGLVGISDLMDEAEAQAPPLTLLSCDWSDKWGQVSLCGLLGSSWLVRGSTLMPLARPSRLRKLGLQQKPSPRPSGGLTAARRGSEKDIAQRGSY